MLSIYNSYHLFSFVLYHLEKEDKKINQDKNLLNKLHFLYLLFSVFIILYWNIYISHILLKQE